jgi:hypothetical protein
MDKGTKPYPFGWGATKPRDKRAKVKQGQTKGPNTAKPRSGANRRGFLIDPPTHLVNQNDPTE